MSLRAGRIEADGKLTDGSMAEMIERAMLDLVAARPDEDPAGRRYLALAIARGVIKHLADNHASFHTTVADWGGTPSHQEAASIDVELDGWS